MFEQETLVPKKTETDDLARRIQPPVVPKSAPRSALEDPGQRRLMLTALILLLITLAGSLYRERDFWLPSDNDEADVADTTTDTSTPAQIVPPVTITQATPAIHVKHRTERKSAPAAKAEASTAVLPPPMSATTTRTVLPPLQVEVVAGDTHRTLRPGSNAVRVELQPGAPNQRMSDPTTTADITTNASERVQMSSDTTQAVTRSVNPGYPLLARQMKVQGAVILRALIGKDGVIQNLQIVSGPSILAAAAENAVRQWRFKPHYQDGEPVETQAKITVNFTISTN